MVVSLSPAWFFNRLAARPDAYAGNFSALHAGELAFNTRLSLQLRQDAARRMLQYPATLADRPLLRFALENLAGGSPVALACYDAILPLAKVYIATLRYKDHWRVVSYLWTHPTSTALPIASHSGQPLDWPLLQRQAEETYRAHSSNNELGLDNEKWIRELRPQLVRQRNTRSDEAFLRTLEQNQEWVDLELLLRELTECRARPLILSIPIHGGWYDQCGVTYAARLAYYRKLREISARYHVPLVDFADRDADRSFCIDNMAHPAPRGLVHYSQVLDGFFHDTVPVQSGLPAPVPVASRGTETGLGSRPSP